MDIFKLFFGQGWFFNLAAVVLLAFAMWRESIDVRQYKKNASTAIPRSHWRFVPGILTAIGVLGTFYGITAGLADISLNNIGADSQNLLKSSVTLLEGMKTAFVTSLVGLGSSSIFTLFLAYCDEERRKEKDSLPTSNMNHDGNKRASQSLADAAKEMGNAAKEMGTKFDDLIKIQDKLSPQAIGQEVGKKVGQQVGNFMQPEFQKILVELTALREIKADQGQEIRKLIEEQQKKLIEPIIAELKKSAKLTEGASEAVMALKNELGGISHSLSESIVTIQKFQQVATEVKDAVNQSIVAMKNQQNAFDVSAEKTAATFKGIREELKKSLETQTQIQQDSIKEFQDSSREIFAEQSTSLKQVGNAASQQMNEARKNLTDTLANIDNVLQNTRLTVQEELQTFRRKYQEDLEEFFRQQNQLLEGTLGEQRQSLADVVANFQTVFEKEYNLRTAWSQEMQEMQESLIKIQQTTKVVSNLANTIGLNSSERFAQLQELALTIGGEASRVEKAYKKLHQNFDEGLGTWSQNFDERLNTWSQNFDERLKTLNQNFNEGLKTWNQELKAYFDQKAESDRKFFTETDKATEQVCHQLLLAATYLATAESNRKNTNEKD